MREIKACGILIIQGRPIESFLLMRHKDRWDLPKGHMDAGETEMQCALRELTEETGIEPSDIEFDPDFRFTIEYDVDSKRFAERCHKTVVYFLARLLRDARIRPSEHAGYEWFRWQPPHRIQAQTIDPLLAAVELYLGQRSHKPEAPARES